MLTSTRSTAVCVFQNQARALVMVQSGDRYVEAVDILSRCGGTYLEPSAAART